MFMISRPRVLSVLSTFVVLSCYGGTDSAEQMPTAPNPPDDASGEPQMPRGTSLFLQVVDSQGNPISRATVTLPLPLPLPPPEAPTPLRAEGRPDRVVQRGAQYLDRVEYRTDPAGNLLMEELEQYIGDRLVAKVEARGYAPASVVLEGVTSGAHMGARAVLLPIAASAAFDTRNGTLIEHEGLRVEIPANGVVDQDGEVFDGIAEISVVPFDSTDRSLVLPGPLTATRTDGTPTFLRSLAMAEVSLSHEGSPLQLAPWASAHVEIPLAQALMADPNPARRPQVGQKIEAWWFDLDKGTWQEEGAGTVIAATGRPGELAWVTDVAHFTWWNVDEPWWNHSCLLVTVFEGGMPKQGVQVQVSGAWGESQAQLTDANGEACTAMAIGEVGTVYIGPENAWLVPPFEVLGQPQAAACDGNGNACQTVPVELDPDDTECEPGEAYECEYSGPPGSEGVGICHGGKRYCGLDLKWGLACEGEQLPLPEDPDSPEDENCNGDPNDGMVGCPQDGLDVACYTGMAGTLGVGECQAGTKKCFLDNGNLIWGPCIGEILPEAEQCGTPEDESCNGNPGCGLTTWTRNGGDALDQMISAVAVGSNDDVFVLGRGTGVMQMTDPANVDLGPSGETFLAHLHPDGTVADIVSLGPDVRGELELAVRGDDQVFVTGTLQGANDKVPGVFAGMDNCPAQVGSATSDGLLLRFTGTKCQQAKVLGGADGPTIPSAVAVAGDRVYVAGAFGGTLGQLQTADIKDDAFVIGLDANDLSAPWQLQKQFASDWPSYSVNRPALAATVDGFAVVFGFGGQVDLAGQTFVPGSKGSSMLALFNHDGVAQWATVLDDHAGEELTSGYAIVLDLEGYVGVAADHGSGLRVSQWREPLGAYWTEDLPDVTMALPELGGSRLVAVSNGSVVLNASAFGHAAMRKWTQDGVGDWANQAAGPGTSDGLGVAVSPIDRSNFVVGRMIGDITFPGNVQLLNVGDSSDGYVVKLQP